MVKEILNFVVDHPWYSLLIFIITYSIISTIWNLIYGFILLRMFQKDKSIKSVNTTLGILKRINSTPMEKEITHIECDNTKCVVYYSNEECEEINKSQLEIKPELLG